MRAYLIAAGFSAPLVKTSGARGLHVVVPLHPRYEYAVVRDLTRRICTELSRRHPQLLSAERDVRKRRAGAVHVDWGAARPRHDDRSAVLTAPVRRRAGLNADRVGISGALRAIAFETPADANVRAIQRANRAGRAQRTR